MADRPNILLVVSDQERQRGWIPPGLTLPHRQRLIDDGLEFTSHYTHSSPCSPSRASLLTGRYVSQHGVTDNVIFPAARRIEPRVGMAGSSSRFAGKITLSVTPCWETYRHFMGWAGTGWQYDPIIA